jgi:TonB family protein
VVALANMSPGMTLDIFVRAAGITDAEYVDPDRRPVLRNQREVERVLRDSYAPHLRDAGIQGTTVFMFMVDTVGVVTHRIVAESSGHPEIDEVSADVVDAMRFSPALVGDCRAPFVAQIPVRMQVAGRE